MAIEGSKPIDILWPEQQATEPVAAGEKGDFARVLVGALTDVRASEQQVEDMAKRFANGDPSVGIHEVMIAAEKASVQLRYAVTLKNKLVQAYRELMNTSV